MRIFGIATAIFLLSMTSQCVDGPVSVGTNHHMSENAVPVSSTNIDSIITETSDIAIIEFYSERCLLCESLIWVIDSLHGTYGDRVFIGAHNTDTKSLNARYSITTVPTYIVFKSGIEVTRLSFIKNEPQVFDTLSQIIQELLSPPDPANYLTLDESSLDTTVLRKGATAMVMFLDTTNLACTRMDSIVGSIASLYKDVAVIAKVHKSEQLSLSNRYNISTFPTCLFFKDSMLVHAETILTDFTLTNVLDQLLARKVVSLDSDNFSDLIDIEGRISVIEFYSETNPVCTSLTWVIDSLYTTFNDAVFLGVTNTDEDMLWNHYNVFSTPTYVLCKSGREMTRRRFTKNEPQVYDTLAILIRELIAGTLTTDTVDTATSPDPGNFITLTDSTFDSIVLQRGKSAMVFFHDTTIMSSVYMDSVMRSIAPHFENRAIVGKINVLKYPQIFDQYYIDLFPQFLFFRDSIQQGIFRLEGVVSGDTLIKQLENVMASKVVSLDSHNFSDSVSINGRVAVVEIYSPTCSACRSFAPRIEALADTFYGTVLVAKVNCEENDSISRSFQVTYLPTIVFLKDGVEYNQLIGTQSMDALVSRVRTGLDSVSTLK